MLEEKYVRENLIKSEWCKYDFDVNKYYWIHKGIDEALPVRKKNMIELVGVFKNNRVPLWLQGKTLLGSFESGKFLNDHDDDIGVDSQYRHVVETSVTKKLEAVGFDMIRNNEAMISYIRDGRYIDVCFFTKKRGKYGYSDKWFPAKYFDHFETINFLGIDISIPNDTQGLLKVMYKNCAVRRVFSIFDKLLSPSKYLNLARRIADKFLNSAPHIIKLVVARLFIPLGLHYKKITLKEFENLLIEPEDSFNWKWRKPHLDIITNNQSVRSVKAIIDYIKNEKGLDLLVSNVIETDTSSEFHEPHNFDSRFWQSGNNYFIYNIKYQFRKGVLQYNYANKYIKDNKIPLLYTADYYESLDIMTKKEIVNLLRHHPIEISDNAVTSGKHRVSAMIGRIVAGEKYIPFWAVVKNY